MRRSEIVKEVMHELQKVCIGEEVTTYELLKRVYQRKGLIIDEEALFFMWIHHQVITKAKDYGVIIDTSIYDDEVLGLAYNIKFLVKKNQK